MREILAEAAEYVEQAGERACSVGEALPVMTAHTLHRRLNEVLDRDDKCRTS